MRSLVNCQGAALTASLHQQLTLSEPSAPESEALTCAVKQSRSALVSGFLVLFITLCGLSLWVAKAPIEGAIIGQGKIVVANKRSIVKHQEGGIVARVAVHEGQRVAAGQVLIEVVDISAMAQLEILETSLAAIRLRKSRLEAEQRLKKTVMFTHDIKQNAAIAALLATEKQSFQAGRSMLDTQLQLIDSQIEDARAGIAGVEKERRQLSRSHQLLRTEIAAASLLVEKHYMARNTLTTLRREAADYRAQLQQRQTQLDQAIQKIRSLQIRQQEVRASYVNQASQALTDINREERQLIEQRIPMQDTIRRQNVVAGVAGTVLAMEPLHVGSVLAPAGRILDIVPDDEALIIKAKVSISDIDEIVAGQSTDIRLNAFSARRTPIILGTVDTVSADSLFDDKSGQNFYSISVLLDQESLDSAGIGPVHPGMPATVYIKTSKRTVLDYLLNPVIIFHEQAMRET